MSSHDDWGFDAKGVRDGGSANRRIMTRPDLIAALVFGGILVVGLVVEWWLFF